MAKYRASWRDASIIWFDLVWRPHVFGILLFEVRYPQVNVSHQRPNQLLNRHCCLVSALALTYV